MSLNKKYNSIDLFSGAGGLSVGLKQAGFNVIAAVESDLLAADSYKRNHPEVNLYEKDISDICIKLLASDLCLERGELDLLAGCPPCQSFSRLKTKNGKIKTNDQSKELIHTFADFIQELLPKCVMLENVPGITNSQQFKEFLAKVADLGYEYTYATLNAKDYNVPQNRKRLIFIASRGGKPRFAPKSEKTVTVRQAFSALDYNKLPDDPLHTYPQNRSERIKRLIALVPKNGGGRLDLPEEYRLNCHKRIDGFRDVYGRMSWDKASPTITGGCINPSKGRFLHPEEDRAITLREASILQGFPKDYVFAMTKGTYAVAQLIGNAFPPELVSQQARMLKPLLENLS